MKTIKDFLNNLSLRSRLIAIILFTTFFTLGIGLTFLGYTSISLLRSDMLDNSVVMAKTIGDYMVSDLVFRQMATETNQNLSKLASIPYIENAVIYDENDKVFAVYNRDRSKKFEPPNLDRPITRFQGDYLHVFQPVFFKDEQIGTIYLRASTQLLKEKISQYLLGLILASVVLLIVSIIITFQLESYISSPILHLAKIAERISVVGDYSVRVKKVRDDEVGKLYDGFNEMLEQIANYTIDLKKLYEEVLNKNKVIEENRSRLQALNDTTPDAVFMHEIDGTIVDVNKTCEEMYGYSKDEMKKMSVGELSGKDYTSERAMNQINLALNWKNPEFEWIAKKKGGQEFPVIVRLRKLHFADKDYVMAIVTDISARKKFEKQIEELKNYLSNIIQSMPSALIAVDTKNRITQWNRSAEELFKKSSNLVIGKKIEVSGEWVTKYKNFIKKTIQTGEDITLIRESLEIGVNQYIVNISFYPISVEDASGVVIRIDDISEAEKKEAQLRQAQKMETVGTLAGGLAHDFNNVLGGIIGTLSIIQYKLKHNDAIPHEKLLQYIDTIEQSANRASEMVQQLLTMSRKHEVLFKPTDLNRVIENVEKICLNSFDKSIELNFEKSPESALINADEAQMEQVVLNVCVNSAHALTIMKKPGEKWGGKIEVHIENCKLDSEFKQSHPDAIEHEYWKLSICDNGIGISPEMKNKIFDPFFTTKSKGEGTGLGLAMVYNIVKQHHGFITVYSELGKGTEFDLYLPKLEEDIQLEEIEETPLEIIRGDGVILVVDDEEIMRLTAQALLEHLGYTVILAENGIMGIELYRAQRERIDLVILDMVMPQKSGKEVFEELRHLNPELKILMASGFKKDSRVEEVLNKGANGFIQKPYTLNRLGKTIMEILENQNDKT